MDTQRIKRVADKLAGARRSSTLLDNLAKDDAPTSIAEAHAMQDATTAALGKPVGAYKAMAPATGEPTRGVIYGDLVHTSPASIPAAQVPQCGVEGEVAFVFRRDLPPRRTPYTRDEVTAAVEACAAIEVVTSRYRNADAASNLEKLADSISNGAFVHAAPGANWRSLDLGQLKATLVVNGETVLESQGKHATGDPLGVAVVFANVMREQGGLRAGQFVTCGTFTGLRYFKPGDVCVVRFEGLGSAEVTFAK